MLLFHCILIFMKDLFQSENQVFNPTRLLAHSLPPPKCSDLSIYPLDFWIMLFFCCIWTLLTYNKQRIKFQTNKFIRNCRVGKDWAGTFFPPSLIFRSFYWSVSLYVYVTLSLYLNTYEWPIPKRESSFQTKHFICTATFWGGERLDRPILSPRPSKMFWSFYLSFSLSVYVILLLYLKTYEWLIAKR